MCHYENIRSDDNKNAECQLLWWNKKKRRHVSSNGVKNTLALEDERIVKSWCWSQNNTAFRKPLESIYINLTAELICESQNFFFLFRFVHTPKRPESLVVNNKLLELH